MLQPYQYCERDVGGEESIKNIVYEKSVNKNDPGEGPQFQIVQSGGKKKIVLKPGSQFSLDILNQVVKMFNDAIDEKRLTEEEEIEGTKDEKKTEEAPIGPIIMQLETNVSMVEDVFTQSPGGENKIEEHVHKEQEDTGPSQRFGRRLLSINEDEVFEEEVDDLGEQAPHTSDEETPSEMNTAAQNPAETKATNVETEKDAVFKEDQDAAVIQTDDLQREEFEQDNDIVKAETCHSNNVIDGGQPELEVNEQKSKQETMSNDRDSAIASGNEADFSNHENEEDGLEKEDGEEEEEDDFDLLDEDSLLEVLSDYNEPLMKITVFMELVDTLEEKLIVKNNKELHTSALQSLIVYIMTTEELATEEDFAIGSSSPTKAAALFASLTSRLDQLKQIHLPQVVAFDHYVGEAWKVFPIKKCPDLLVLISSNLILIFFRSLW